MAHVVRTVMLDAVGHERVYGVALEFMPESEDALIAVARFVQRVLILDEPTPGAPRMSPRLPARAVGDQRSDAQTVIRQLSVRSMTLATNWQVAQGERIRVEIAAPGRARRIELEGSAVRVTPRNASRGEPPYEIEVAFQSEVERPPRRPSSTTFAAVDPEAMSTTTSARVSATPEELPPGRGDVARVLDDLFAALIHPPAEARPKREHLSGLLSRIRLPTLCALFDMERLSGELTLQRENERVVVYLRDGQLIDVDDLGASPTLRARIADILAWEDGSFYFDVKVVDRPDRIGVSTTALLLDLAREEDEKRANQF